MKISLIDRVENTVGKGENAMLLENALNLNLLEILLCGEELSSFSKIIARLDW